MSWTLYLWKTYIRHVVVSFSKFILQISALKEFAYLNRTDLRLYRRRRVTFGPALYWICCDVVKQLLPQRYIYSYTDYSCAVAQLCIRQLIVGLRLRLYGLLIDMIVLKHYYFSFHQEINSSLLQEHARFSSILCLSLDLIWSSLLGVQCLSVTYVVLTCTSDWLYSRSKFSVFVSSDS